MKIGIIGGYGKMANAIKESHEKIAFCWDRSTMPNAQDINKADVIIDFSSPSALPTYAEILQKNPKPIVIGTTGFQNNENDIMKDLSNNMPVLYSPNMLFGVHIIKKILKEFKGFEMHQHEIHHAEKKDKPSGTALYLAQDHNMPTTSARIGKVYGKHIIYLTKDEEVIEISHTATSRAAFAKGAINAASWLIQQKPGYYTFNDML